MILASYDEWDYVAIVPRNRREALREETVQSSKLKIEVFKYAMLEYGSPDIFETLKSLLGTSNQPSNINELYRRTACLIAAN